MKDNKFENKNLKFIWGVKSPMDLTESEPCLYTMNDIDICYDKKNKCYLLGVETGLMFKNKKEEYNYLKELLDKFSDYIKKKIRKLKHQNIIFSLKILQIPILKVSRNVMRGLIFSFVDLPSKTQIV